MKTCPQCGRSLEDDQFRIYSYQSRQAQSTKVPRRNVVCKDCEYFNKNTDRAYRASPRTPYQQYLIDEATKIYKALIDRGLEPRGALASTLTGRPVRGAGSHDPSAYAATIGLGGDTDENV